MLAPDLAPLFAWLPPTWAAAFSIFDLCKSSAAHSCILFTGGSGSEGSLGNVSLGRLYISGLLIDLALKYSQVHA